MEIFVLLKQTFDTEEHIVVKDGRVSEDGVTFIINPYDEYAVEEAVALKEEHGGTVTVITVGPERTEEALKTALAMGADRAIRVDDENLDPDELTVSQLLAAVIKDREYDLILCGYMAVDDGSAQVGPRVAELLDIPHISTIVDLKLNADEGQANIERDVEGNLEKLTVSLPALFSAQQGLNEPRYPSLPAMMKAKRKSIERLCIDDINIDDQDIRNDKELIEHFLPPKKQPGIIFEGNMTEQVKKLVEALRDKVNLV